MNGGRFGSGKLGFVDVCGSRKIEANDFARVRDAVDPFVGDWHEGLNRTRWGSGGFSAM